jgi:hypothetical protein
MLRNPPIAELRPSFHRKYAQYVIALLVPVVQFYKVGFGKIMRFVKIRRFLELAAGSELDGFILGKKPYSPANEPFF